MSFGGIQVASERTRERTHPCVRFAGIPAGTIWLKVLQF